MEAIANIQDSSSHGRKMTMTLSSISNILGQIRPEVLPSRAFIGRKTQNGTRMKIQMSQRNKTEALSLVSSKAMTVVKLFSEHK